MWTFYFLKGASCSCEKEESAGPPPGLCVQGVGGNESRAVSNGCTAGTRQGAGAQARRLSQAWSPDFVLRFQHDPDTHSARSASFGRRMVMADALSLGKRALSETAQCQRIRIDLLCAGRSGGKQGSPCPDSPLVPR